MPSPDARYDSWYEVWTTWSGVYENSYDLLTRFDADEKVQELKDEFHANCKPSDDLAIYLLHHTCGQSVECDCAQYVSDHHPVWRSKELT